MPGFESLRFSYRTSWETSPRRNGAGVAGRLSMTAEEVTKGEPVHTGSLPAVVGVRRGAEAM